MHYDKKTGLAVAVLLTGAIAAFFFRNDSMQKDDPPELKNEELVDREIAGKNTPYSDDSDHSNPARFTGAIKEPISPSKERSEVAHKSESNDWNIPLPDFLNRDSKEESQQPRSDKNSVATMTNKRISRNPPTSNGEYQSPVPIAVDKEKFQGDSQSAPEHNKEWKIASNTRETRNRASSRNSHSQKSQQGEIYTIRSGDTLSGIASRFLGSSSKYFEIFQANRDVIDNPDNLLPGTEIRIPNGRLDRTKTFPVSDIKEFRKTTPLSTDFVKDESQSSNRQVGNGSKSHETEFQPKLVPTRRWIYFPRRRLKK